MHLFDTGCPGFFLSERDADYERLKTEPGHFEILVGRIWGRCYRRCRDG